MTQSIINCGNVKRSYVCGEVSERGREETEEVREILIVDAVTLVRSRGGWFKGRKHGFSFSVKSRK